MKKLLLLIGLAFLINGCKFSFEKKETIKKKEPNTFAIVIHGGAGDGITTKNFNSEIKKAYEKKLTKAVTKGYTVLEKGGKAIDAIQAAITIMEDSPLFNAGKGAVYNSEGKQEMDASIMDGNSLNSGAVAGVNYIKNPILAARVVMDSSKHVMLSGKGAVILAKKYGVELVDSTYFYSEKRFNQIKRIKEKEKATIKKVANTNIFDAIKDTKYGTVGAVAIDKDGNIAAGTSTGGMTNKKYGRIGDSPIIGAGTYANNATCGISATGTGEYFIRTVATHEVSSLINYKKMSPKNALHEVLVNQIEKLGGKGGFILLDKYGDVYWDFNTTGMFRAYKKSDGTFKVAMFKE